VGAICWAPKPRPIAIAMKRYASSKGSLIGVLNLIIDSAPTKPRDKARDDFTTLIIKNVTSAITTKVLPIDCDLEI
jgi:hypothetical protein